MTPSSARLAQIFTAAGHFYVHFFTSCYAVIVLDLEKKWQLPYKELLPLGTWGLLLFGAGALPAGWLGDRWSARGMLAVFFLGIGGSALYCGLAGTPNGLFIGLTAIGLFASIYHPVGIAWLVRNCEQQGKTLGLNGVFGNFGVGFAGLIAGLLIDLADWRAAFVVPAAITIITGLVFIGLCLSGRIDEGSERKPATAAATRNEMLRGITILFIGMFCSGIIYQGTQWALPKAFDDLVQPLRHDIAAIGLAVSIVYLVAGVLQLLGGHFADRYPAKPVYLMAYLLQVPLLAVMASSVGVPLIVASLLAVTLSVGVFPAESMLFVRFTPHRHRSLAFGARYVIGFGVGPLAINLVSYIHGLTNSFFWLFALLALAAAVIASIALLLPGDGKPAARLAPAE